MIKNLMNNPWFVGALGLVAAVYLGWTVGQPLFLGSQELAGDLAEDVAEDLVRIQYADYEEESEEAVKESSVDLRQDIRWLHDVERDPFAGMAYSAMSDESNVSEPTVGALFISQGVRAAVVENRLVRVGDNVNQYTVTAIGDDFVELKYRGKALRVHPEA